MKEFRYLEKITILKLDDAACIGCGMCITVCPHGVFTLRDGKAQITDHGGCMECGACACNCPAGALFVNPDEGCGCAALIINGWLARITGNNISNCGC
jgi:ferredoxin